MKKNLHKLFINLSLLLFLLIAVFTPAFTQTPYNVIQGQVWIENDNSVDGLKQVAERKLPGIVVSLYTEADFQPLSVTLTDASGSYTLENYAGVGSYTLVFDFPRPGFGTDDTDAATLANVGSDFSINSRVIYDDENDFYSTDINVTTPSAINANMGLVRRLNTVTYCGMHEAQVAWPTPTNINVPKVPAYLTTPSTGATFWASAAVHNPLIRFENQAIQPDNMTLAVGVNARIFRADQPVNISTSIGLTSSYFLAEVLPAYDTELDYGGASGRTLTNKFSKQVGTGTNVSASIVNASYRGGGTSAFPAEMVATTTISGGGNLATQVSTFGAAGACMVYRFGINPLPINLVSFTAVKDNGRVKLRWVTSAEVNNMGFDIEHSADGKNWSTIDFVKSKSLEAVSASPLIYDYSHSGVINGVNFYRLKQIDIDGKFEYSDIASVNFEGKGSVSIFPNPVQKSGTLNFAGLGQSSLIEIYDMTGSRVFYKNLNKTNEQVDMTTFASGIYNVVVKNLDSGESYSQKIVK